MYQHNEGQPARDTSAEMERLGLLKHTEHSPSLTHFESAGRCQACDDTRPVSGFSTARQPKPSLRGLLLHAAVRFSGLYGISKLPSRAMAIKAKLAAGPAFHGQTDLGQQILHCSRSVIDHVFRRFPAIHATCAKGASALR